MRQPSQTLQLAFVLLVFMVGAALVALLFMFSSKQRSEKRVIVYGLTALFTAQLVVPGLLARQGVLLDFSPPRLPVLVLVLAAGSVAFAASRAGLRLIAVTPAWTIVALNAFRLPLELIMHRAATEGVMPLQMSFEGRNFDILTGISAIGVALYMRSGKAPSWLPRAWNVMGLLLLVNVVTVAVLSMPTPLRVFLNEPPNVWVTHFPFVWLPCFLVQLALISHLLMFRYPAQVRVKTT
jgi:hypothetical protein